METENKRLGRQPLPQGEKKKKIVAFVPEKMVVAIGEPECKKIAEDSIIAHYGNLPPKKRK